MTRPIDGATDVHVHLLPEGLMGAIRDALTDQLDWEFEHPIDQRSMEVELRTHGVERYCALPYAHKSGVAMAINDWLLDAAEASDMCVPFASVHPEDDVRAVVREAFESGARGLKFHCPVQEVAPDDPRLEPAYDLAAAFDRPVLFHAGNAPAYRDSPHVGVEHFEAFCEAHPDVRAAGAHMGTYETEAFLDVLRDHDNAFLDTSFALSTAAQGVMDFDPSSVADEVFETFAGRIMYGSDYPNVPYPYEAEYVEHLERDLSAAASEALFAGAADRFLNG
jgi:predicted TIM-barrel fold metal-dependent hydrolase